MQKASFLINPAKEKIMDADVMKKFEETLASAFNYANARLIARPDSEWLQAESVSESRAA